MSNCRRCDAWAQYQGDLPGKCRCQESEESKAQYVRLQDTEVTAEVVGFLRKENAELKAHVERLRVTLERILDPYDPKDWWEILEETPAQSLAEVKAEVLEQMARAIGRGHSYQSVIDVVDHLKFEADRIREEAKQ